MTSGNSAVGGVCGFSQAIDSGSQRIMIFVEMGMEEIRVDTN